jgi:hypothetical protein
VEIQGGTWTGGRHIRGAGYARDCRKLNAAAANGIFTLYFTTEMVTKGNIARDTTLAVLERLRSEPARCDRTTKGEALSSPEVAYRPVIAA